PPLSKQRFAQAVKALEEYYRTSPLDFRSVPYAVLGWNLQGLDSDPRPGRFQRLLDYQLEDMGRFAERFKNRPMSIYILGHRDRVGIDGLKLLGAWEEKTLDQLFPY
ncbi:MAG: hypothetical protein WC881_09705, partial [Elusimicrobiota bacterium]